MLIHLLLAFSLTLTVMGDAQSRRDRLKALEADVASSAALLRDTVAAVRDPDEPNAAIDDLRARTSERRKTDLAAALKLADEDPASDVGFDALQWLVLNGPPDEQVLALLSRFHAANPKLGQSAAILRLGLHPPYGLPGAQEPSLPRYTAEHAAMMELLNAIVAKNPDRNARGQALVGLAMQVKRAYDFAEFYRRATAAELRADADKRFTEIAKDYAECPALSEGANPRWTDANQRIKGAATLGDIAQSKLAQLRNFASLMSGKSARDIAGEDLDGVKFKLSDYRGKVVMLVFWASWCGPCMADVPHELELIKQFKDKPFVLIGVNADENNANAQQAIGSKHISWRSFRDGGSGQFAPITSAWNVYALPTVFVLDQHGIVRYEYVDGKELDAALEKLVGEATVKGAAQ